MAVWHVCLQTVSDFSVSGRGLVFSGHTAKKYSTKLEQLRIETGQIILDKLLTTDVNRVNETHDGDTDSCWHRLRFNGRRKDQ